MAERDPSPKLGSIFEGRYEILSEAGTGAFGRVYRARQSSTGQEVAIKILRFVESDTTEAQEHYAQRFRREMEHCANLSHPHIVRLIDSGESDDGRLYVVFEFVPGSTLRHVLEAEGKLAVSEAIHLMAQVLDALGSAHAVGIIHRDVKPENIMVSQTGIRRNAMVLDFGLSAATPRDLATDLTRLTTTGQLLGTPCYAAPEQLRGEAVSPRADLYSWGLVFLECVTGELAMGGDGPHDVLMRQLGPERAPIPPWLPERLRRVLATVTAKDVDKRDVTIAGLLESLGMIARDVMPSGPGSEPAAARVGERRQVTLVACRTTVVRIDGARIDAEELDEVLKSRHALCERIAREHGGMVGSAMTDSVLLVFGYPRVQEHDARRAVRAALRIVAEGSGVEERSETERKVGVDISAGVHSGLAIVRERRDGSNGLELVGTPPSVAARLVERAGPGHVILSAETRGLLRGEMKCEPAGTMYVPEHGGSVTVFRADEQHVEASARSAEASLVDRSAELGQLTELWQQAAGGDARVVLVTGEPGIGKSRLIRELGRRVPSEAWFECRCTAESRDSPLRPLIELLLDMPAPIDALLTRYGFELSDTLPLFASLLAIPLDSRYAPLRLSPDRRKELTLNALLSLLLRMLRDRPGVFVVEDLHWADPTTLEFLALLIDEAMAPRTPGPDEWGGIYVVLSARPEFTPSWNTADVTVQSLSRLGRAGIEHLVNATLMLTDEPPLSGDVLDHIVTRTDGVPLFVEEMTHVVAESRARSGPSGHYDRVAPDLEVPGTLRELLAARLDTLSSSARDTVQLVAALGREFRYDVLRSVSSKDEWVLRQDLSELTGKRLLYGRRIATESFIFKHSLVRDAAYESMLRSTRCRVHRQIAAVLQRQFPDVAERQPDLLAQHLEAAGEIAAAIEQWHRAGDRALRRAAYEEATRQLRRGLTGIERLPPSKDRTHMETELLTTLGTALFSTRGYADPEVEQTFERGRGLCEQLGEAVSPKILAGIMGVYITRDDRAATDALLPQFRQLAEHDDPVSLVTAYATLGQVAFWRGEHERARPHLDTARSAYLTDEFRRFAENYGYDGGVFSCTYRMWNLWALGYPEQGEVQYRELMGIATRSFDPYTLPLALAFGMNQSHSRRDGEETRARADRLIELSTDQKLYFWLAVGMCGRGVACTLQGDPADGIEDIRQGLDTLRMIGAMISYSYYLTYLVEALFASGQSDEALAVVEQGLSLCGSSLGRFHEPELHRLRGELMYGAGDVAAAEMGLGQAVDLARRRHARSWEIRAANSLGRLLRDRGKSADARSVISDAYGRFTEGFDLPDLRDARELLGELR